MTFWKRTVPIIMSAALTLLPLAGCGTDPDTSHTDDSSSATGSVNVAAMGRYIEEEWELPDDYEMLLALHKRPDGRIAMLLGDQSLDNLTYYSTSDGKDWQQDPPDWLSELLGKAEYLNTISFNSRGEGVTSYYSMDTGYRAAYISEDGILTDIPIESDPWESMDYYTRAIRVIEDSDDDSESTTGITIPPGGGTLHIETDGIDALTDNGEAANPTEQTTVSAMPSTESTEEEAEDVASNGEQASDDDADANAFMPEDSSSQLYIRDAVMGEDGFVYIGSFQQFGAFNVESGELVHDFEQYATSSAVTSDEVIQLLQRDELMYLSDNPPDEDEIRFYNATSGAETRNLPAAVFSGQSIITGMSDGSIYVTGPAGLFRLAPGGDTWEKIIDGALSSLSIPSMSLLGTVPHGDNEFLLYLGRSNAPTLINCVYSTDTPTMPDTELTVYTLYDNKTVRQAIGTFRQRNPNVLVNVQELLNGEGSATAEDAIKSLNTELLAGKGPDLFLLDDMPVESYIEKGVLADISDVVQPMMDNGELLDNILGTYRTGSALYAVPTRFEIPTVWGAQDAIDAASNLSDMVSWASSHPNDRSFIDLSPAWLMYQYAPVMQDGFLGTDGQIDVDKLAQFYNDIAALSATAVGQLNAGVFSDEGETIFDTAMWDDFFEADNPGMMALHMDKAKLMFARLNGYLSMIQPNGAVYAQRGFSIVSEDDDWNSTVPEEMVDGVFRPMGDGIFYPSSIIGVNAAGSQQELAGEFVRAMLSTGTQNADQENGFPVNRESIEYLIKTPNYWYMSFGIYDEDEGKTYAAEMAYPEGYMLQAMSDTFEALTTPVILNIPLLEMIINESTSFFDGGITAREAAENVRQKARILLAE